MSVTERQNAYCHAKLPIDDDECVLEIYHHHIFAYILPLLIAFFVIVIVLGLAVLLNTVHGISATPIIAPAYRNLSYAFAGTLSGLVLIFAYIPVWLRLQEKIVLTDEAILQVLQPSLFSDKVSQTSLERIADVSIRQDFLGNLMGYGKLSVETPGEQDNYEYVYLPKPHQAAKQIIEAHENFSAALQGGKLPTTLGVQPAPPHASTQQTTVSLDPAQYQAFLSYQQQQAQAGQAGSNPVSQTPSNSVDPVVPGQS